jgi:hypothetical protein
MALLKYVGLFRAKEIFNESRVTYCKGNTICYIADNHIKVRKFGFLIIKRIMMLNLIHFLPFRKSDFKRAVWVAIDLIPHFFKGSAIPHHELFWFDIMFSIEM